MSFGHSILSAERIPIPPLARFSVKFILFVYFGGAYEICTRVQAFAEPCLTTRPTRHYRHIINYSSEKTVCRKY
jgi:hypothetical protein